MHQQDIHQATSFVAFDLCLLLPVHLKGSMAWLCDGGPLHMYSQNHCNRAPQMAAILDCCWSWNGTENLVNLVCIPRITQLFVAWPCKCPSTFTWTFIQVPQWHHKHFVAASDLTSASGDRHWRFTHRSWEIYCQGSLRYKLYVATDTDRSRMEQQMLAKNCLFYRFGERPIVCEEIHIAPEHISRQKNTSWRHKMAPQRKWREYFAREINQFFTCLWVCVSGSLRS